MTPGTPIDFVPTQGKPVDLHEIEDLGLMDTSGDYVRVPQQDRGQHRREIVRPTLSERLAKVRSVFGRLGTK
jgi:hypothetical protein